MPIIVFGLVSYIRINPAKAAQEFLDQPDKTVIGRCVLRRVRHSVVRQTAVTWHGSCRSKLQDEIRAGTIRHFAADSSRLSNSFTNGFTIRFTRALLFVLNSVVKNQ